LTDPGPIPRAADSTHVRVAADARRIREGDAALFDIVLQGVKRAAFVVRYRGRLLAYVNSCMHERLPLDFGDAHFFDEACDALVCCHHGARYRPETGECVAGPCVGSRLTPLRLEERGTELWCVGAASPTPA
jgi:nitrite reductase/ring-hydroxylating ferredoxin subunit